MLELLLKRTGWIDLETQNPWKIRLKNSKNQPWPFFT